MTDRVSRQSQIPFSLLRRVFVSPYVHQFAMALVTVMICCSGCEQSDRGAGGKTTVTPPKVVFVLVDRSRSVSEDSSLYSRTLDRIISSLVSGDRILVGTITAISSHDLAEMLDRELPSPPQPFNPLVDNEGLYKKRTAAFKDTLHTSIDSIEKGVSLLLGSMRDAPSTSIIDALQTAAQVFASENRRKILILLSDMIEESKVCNLARSLIDSVFIRKEIEREREAGLLPNLAGVKIYVVGAEGLNPEHAAAVERFWRAYFSASGATLASGGYGRVLARFEE